ncbi:hypothetical protein XCV1229 [Xanthomonas euvesicatoria pv. vesicatoria str. 85-10]|uniref:Uncharacterized protein n=1 Tax=Xanthomonas euvesicatoria pv. vesicatoria (strain 85-10) TaxID=316273 RepID=Q3BWA3_XANE5|nr:hypothetical protein XCV1229 [Xanthomonas euvesicatoria pv. vesicatoria str. 85-10]
MRCYVIPGVAAHAHSSAPGVARAVSGCCRAVIAAPGADPGRRVSAITSTRQQLTPIARRGAPVSTLGVNVVRNMPASSTANAPDTAAIGQIATQPAARASVAPATSTRHRTHTVTPRRSWTRVDAGASVVRIFCLQGNAQ